MARGLFVEPFFGGSHRAFAEGLVAHGGHELELLTLPGREWRRRMRLGAQLLAERVGEVAGEFDFLLVSDMLDLAAFLALTRPRFERTPVLLFMHENQLTYPRLRGTKLNSWFGQINYLSALAADRVAFNSEYHRDDFLGALEELERQPNNWLTTAGIESIRGKNSVLPVGVDLASLGEGPAAAPAGGSPLILWNHRWEFDKSPEGFVRTVTALAEEGLDFRVAVAGERGDNPSEAMSGAAGAAGGAAGAVRAGPGAPGVCAAAVGGGYQHQQHAARVLRHLDGRGDVLRVSADCAASLQLPGARAGVAAGAVPLRDGGGVAGAHAGGHPFGGK